MTCTSCEVIIERTIKKLNGVEAVTVSQQTGRCVIQHQSGQKIPVSTIQEALADTDYKVEMSNSSSTTKTANTMGWKGWMRIALIMGVVYVIATQFNILSFNISDEDNLTLPAVFVIGLVASVSSCIAVVGGLVLTVTAKLKQAKPNATKWELLRMHLLFNGGRLLSYFILGGIVGLIGTALAPSAKVMGIIYIIVALVMILLALDLLGISGTKRWIPKMPKRLSHAIHDLAEREEPWIPILLGALTFFLPCGFTQSMQLYALTTGSFWQGGLVLLVFALGTLPALFGIGVLASVAKTKGAAYRYFMVTAGAIVLLLGLYNIQNGLNLLGINSSSWLSSSSEPATEATSGDGVQVINMAVQGIDYIPEAITIEAGVPVEWHIDATGATGCTSSLVVPSLKISKRLSRSQDNLITFTPTTTGTIPFTCSMGMAYGEFTVVDKLEQKTNQEPEGVCDSVTQTCSIK